MNFIIKLFSTGFFIGYIPGAPGSYASVAGALLWWYLPRQSFYAVFAALFLISLLICGRAEILFNKKDDERIVIDEFLGFFTTVAFLPKNLIVLIAGFVFFRLFDIKKPFFIKSVQKYSGSAGIILDDILAGIVSNIIIRMMLVFVKI